ncbi:serine/threonine kinase family protein [Plesiocystis pacifica SIR-1]|uniref:Serine/threonine kinase family protein n=2 Tax=Plesiocystis pacifica TaxID=191768 RepID=A6GBW6_9BACT|nr:serine/threonine kinase family protein [Plesiocystis pacifica SIR-1]
MGEVVAAFDEELNRSVAIKVMRRGRPRSRSMIRLQREAQAMAKVSHPNVVAVYDVGRHGLDEQVFIAMEYVDGPTLAEWTRERRPWREILDVFIGAGRGLEAAHAAGLIHRDFKPENVLLTSDGVAKVSDFGLVRASADSISVEDPGRSGSLAFPPSLDESFEVLVDSRANTVSEDPFSERLTRAGAMVGTPAFMAPEQFLGKPADAAADQFAFCVALYSALYRAPPFGGADVAELRGAVLSDSRMPRPGDREVPGWLAAVVERGLANAPEDRWPSMSALLHALEKDPSLRRRRWLAVGGVVAIVVGAGLGLASIEQAERARCEAEGEVAAQRWDTAAPRVREALLGTGLSFAPELWARSERSFEGWSERWRPARVAACRAAREETEDASAVVACLDAQLDDLDGTLEVLRSSDRVTGSYALEALAQLPNPARCEDPLWLRAQTQLDDRTEREQASSVRRSIVQARLLSQAGRSRGAYNLARAIVADAPQQGPLSAEARLALGQAAEGASDYGEAREALEAAHYEAEAFGHDRVALTAALELSHVYVLLGDAQRGKEWLRRADALTRRLGSLKEDRVRLLAAEAEHHYLVKDYEPATRVAWDYLTLAEATYPASHPQVAEALDTVGKNQAALGEIEGAVETFTRARERYADSFGAEHPRVIEVELHLARAKRDAGDVPAAIVAFEQALARLEAEYGEDQLQVFTTRRLLVDTLLRAGRRDEALVLQEQTIPIAERLFGPDNVQLVPSLTASARLYRGFGRFEEAQAMLERAEAIARAAYGSEHIDTMVTTYELTRLREQRGESPEVLLPLYRQVFTAFTKAYGLEHDNTTVVLSIIGQAQCELGRYDAGLADLRRATQLIGEDATRGKIRVTIFQSMLIECMAEAGHWEDALPIIREALATRAAELGDADPARSVFLYNLVDALLATGDLEGALAASEETRTIFEAEPPSTLAGRVDYWNNRARVLHVSGADPQAARALVDEGLAAIAAARDGELAKGQSPESIEALAARLRGYRKPPRGGA